MSLQQRWNEEIAGDVRVWGEVNLPPEDPYRVIGDHINELLDEDDFAFMYSPLGRGAVCPVMLALISVFQAREKLGDRAAAAMARRRLDCLYALHLPLTWGGFHHSDLSNFRKRVLTHEAEALIFEKVLALVQGLGFLKGVQMQRSDSTHILSCTERLGRLELVWETLRLALQAIECYGGAWCPTRIPEVFRQTYSTRRGTWHLKYGEMLEELVRVGQDGLWLLAQLDTSAPPEVLAQPEIATFRTVWAQRFEVSAEAEGDQETVVLKKQGGRGKGKEQIVTPYDADVRWFQKRDTEWEGYKLHVTETVDETVSVQFITDVDLVAANAGDSEAVADIQTRLITRDLAPSEHYVDQGYTSGRNLAESAARGIELVGPIGLDTSGKPEGYRLADFILDAETREATCPAGHTVPLILKGDPPGSQGSAADFHTHCATCPARAVCAPGPQGRRIRTQPYHQLREARRAEQQTAAFKERIKRRSAVEGTISELVRCYGVRHARYRGQAKVRLQILFAGAAANLNRLSRVLSLQPVPHPS